jgi:hypothetical protein
MNRNLRIARQGQPAVRRAIRENQTQLEQLTDIADVLLSNGITPAQVHVLIGSAFARAAARTAQLKNGRTNYSRVAARTGLRRTVVRNLLHREAKTPDIQSPLNRLALAWRSDGDFLDNAGRPKQLAIVGRHDAFARLAHRYAPDIPKRALIDELVDSGLASIRGKVLILSRTRNAKRLLASKAFHASVRAFLTCWRQSVHMKRRRS